MVEFCNKLLNDLYDEAMNDNVILFFGSFSKISPNGYIEEGEFKDGRLNGQGKVSKNGGNFKEGYFISGKLYNQNCKKYKPYKLEYLNEYFGKIINDNSKILKLALKLGWILTRCSNHNVYKKENKTLILSCSPKFPSDNYFTLRNAELELLEIDY